MQPSQKSLVCEMKHNLQAVPLEMAMLLQCVACWMSTHQSPNAIWTVATNDEQNHKWAVSIHFSSNREHGWRLGFCHVEWGTEDKHNTCHIGSWRSVKEFQSQCESGLAQQMSLIQWTENKVMCTGAAALNKSLKVSTTLAEVDWESDCKNGCVSKRKPDSFPSFRKPHWRHGGHRTEQSIEI